MRKFFAHTGVVALAVGGAVLASAPASSADSAAPTCPMGYISLCLSYGGGQTPENVAVAPGGDLDVSFSIAREIADVDHDGNIRQLAVMKVPADGGTNTPVLHFAATMGVVRGCDGTVYFLYATGDADTTGVYRVVPGGAPHLVAALPADTLPNGLALDPRSKTLYVTDSYNGAIWRVPTTGGIATSWLTATTAPQLASTGYLGANGLKVHDGAVWVSNTDQGTIVRIPILADGRAGRPEVRASQMPSIDDFTFVGPGDQILAAVNKDDEIVRIDSTGTQATETTVLTADDGLNNPTSLAVDGGSVYVMDAAYLTRLDPNFLRVPLTAVESGRQATSWPSTWPRW